MFTLSVQFWKPGLRNVFKFLVSTGKPDNVTGGVDAGNVPRAVADAALADTDATAVEALEIMLLAWAAECRACLRNLNLSGFKHFFCRVTNVSSCAAEQVLLVMV